MVKKFKNSSEILKWVIVSYNILNNLFSMLKIRLGIIKTARDKLLGKKSVSQSIEYINRVFKDYLNYSPLTLKDLKNKSILEIGPGDNLGVAIKFIMSGALNVICLDKFYIERDLERELILYREMRKIFNNKKYFDHFLDLKKEIKINKHRLNYIYGYGIDDSLTLFKKESFDLIISRAVLEHIYNIDEAFNVMDIILKRGGIIIHKIDFRDQGMFTEYGFHPLTFLTIPEFIYKLMVKHSSKPNRNLIDFYINKMKSLEYKTDIFITSIVGQHDELLPHKKESLYNLDYQKSNDLVISIQNSLLKKFRCLSVKQLSISGIFLISQKL